VSVPQPVLNPNLVANGKDGEKRRSVVEGVSTVRERGATTEFVKLPSSQQQQKRKRGRSGTGTTTTAFSSEAMDHGASRDFKGEEEYFDDDESVAKRNLSYP
jgi:hypothetical protein